MVGKCHALVPDPSPPNIPQVDPCLDVPDRKCWDQWLGSVGYNPNY